jgi:phage terminase large subunit GpA-like protein
MTDLTTTALAALKTLVPPPRLVLSAWLEGNVVLPSDSALPGRLKLTNLQRGICDTMSDPTIERVSVVKPVRGGYTLIMTGGILANLVNDPKSQILLYATDRNCRSYAIDHLDPLVQASPNLRGLLEDDTEGDRNTMCSRRTRNGGSIRILPTTAENTLRGHTCSRLWGDEIDAMDPGSEGNPLKLGERRTLSFADRKLIYGSTPKFLETSPILKLYAQSDRRIFEWLWPCCGAFAKPEWEYVKYPPGHPEEAEIECPNCKTWMSESQRAKAVEQGQWRVTCPEVVGHAGFMFDALSGFMPHTTLPALAKEYELSRKNPADLQTFVNTLLALGWTPPPMVDEKALLTRGEPFDLDHLPEQVVSLQLGCDVHDGYLVVVIIGSAQCEPDKTPETFVLFHTIIKGSYTDLSQSSPWRKLQSLILQTFPHPLGGRLPIDASFIDGGDGQHISTVVRFAASFPRQRRVWAGRGVPHTTDDFVVSDVTSKKGRKARRFALANSTDIKGRIYSMIKEGRGLRFSHTLTEKFYSELASEHEVIHIRNGQEVRHYEKLTHNTPNHALDALTYAISVRRDVWPEVSKYNYTNALKRVCRSGQIPVQQQAIGAEEPPAALSAERTEEWYQQQSEKLLQQHPELRNDPEVAKLLREIELEDDSDDEG